jgi:hypothetical protein
MTRPARTPAAASAIIGIIVGIGMGVALVSSLKQQGITAIAAQ